YCMATSRWHYHDWCNGDDVGSFLECVGRMEICSCAESCSILIQMTRYTKTNNTIFEAVCGYKLYQLKEHVKEMERDIKFLVEEIDALYDQTSSLMLANLS
ncbi:hypothetical protein PMAYCL1PPCAC_11000, partial [Pristionchus mayeri]